MSQSKGKLTSENGNSRAQEPRRRRKDPLAVSQVPGERDGHSRAKTGPRMEHCPNPKCGAWHVKGTHGVCGLCGGKT